MTTMTDEEFDAFLLERCPIDLSGITDETVKRRVSRDIYKLHCRMTMQRYKAVAKAHEDCNKTYMEEYKRNRPWLNR